MLIPSLDISLSYLAISVPFLLLWFAFFLFFPRVRKSLAKTTLLFAFVGVVVENVFYLKDYWHPVGVYGLHIGSWVILPEFLLFGMAFAGVSAVVYPVVCRKYLRSHGDVSLQTMLLRALVLLGTFSVVAFGLVYAGINSIYATSFAAIAMSTYMILQRTDLFLPSILSATLTTGVLFFCYSLLVFSIGNVETLLSHIWLLHGTALDIRIMRIPLTELIWAWSVGSAIGIYYVFIRGSTFEA